MLKTRIVNAREQLQRLGTSARRSSLQHIERRDTRLRYVSQLLNALSYKGVLERGFALVRDAAGSPLHRAAGVSPGQPISIEFADGRIGATSDTDGNTPANPKDPTRPKPATKRTTDFGVKKVQGDLF